MSHCVIQTKLAAASSMPVAATTPAPKRRVRKPPTTAPTGRATRKRTSTSAAASCESRWVVVRAKSGMSSTAAISAAPMKKLTRIAPQAGLRAEGAARHQRVLGTA